MITAMILTGACVILFPAVRGLARIEGELIDGDPEELTRSVCSSYELTGIVVHSGQASGGHYYSYILHRWGSTDTTRCTVIAVCCAGRVCPGLIHM